MISVIHPDSALCPAHSNQSRQRQCPGVVLLNFSLPLLGVETPTTSLATVKEASTELALQAQMKCVQSNIAFGGAPRQLWCRAVAAGILLPETCLETDRPRNPDTNTVSIHLFIYPSNRTTIRRWATVRARDLTEKLSFKIIINF